MTSESEVREASKTFYAALNRMLNGDAGAMAEIWSHDPSITSLHPIGGRQVGWDEVRASFESVAAIAADGQVRLDDQRIQVGGDLAYEIGIERGQATMAGKQAPIEHRVTNVYRREAGGWRIVHHHTDVAPAMVDIVHGLKAGT